MLCPQRLLAKVQGSQLALLSAARAHQVLRQGKPSADVLGGGQEVQLGALGGWRETLSLRQHSLACADAPAELASLAAQARWAVEVELLQAACPSTAVCSWHARYNQKLLGPYHLGMCSFMICLRGHVAPP